MQTCLKCGRFTLNRKHWPHHKLYFLLDKCCRQCTTFQEQFTVLAGQNIFRNLTCKTHQQTVHLSNFKNIFEEWNMSAWFSWLLNTFSPQDSCLNHAVKGCYSSCLNIWQLSSCHATDSPLPSVFVLFPVAVTVQVNGHLAHDLSCTA